MLLDHEIAHIQNGDLKFLAGLRWTSIPLWANPLFWLFRRSVQLDQEILADEFASARDRAGYAEQLAAWGRWHSLAPRWSWRGHVGVGHGASQLRRRMHYLVHARRIRRGRVRASGRSLR